MIKNTVVAFRVLLASLRGTEVAIYDYAVANEEILGNKSIILMCMNGRHNELVVRKFAKKFSVYFYRTVDEIERILFACKCRVLYTIAYGERCVNDPTLSVNGIYKTALHCVFSMSDPHADTYVPISHYLGSKFGCSTFVPHMISLNPCMNHHNHELRNRLGIPNSAIVFGRYGGYETFNISFVHDTIKTVVSNHKNIYFLFVNTQKFIIHHQVKYLSPIVDDEEKLSFISTCDAMIHARADGETFGIACGEFSVCNKPIITCKSGDTAHIDILGDRCVLYSNATQLETIFINFTDVKRKKEEELKEKGYAKDRLWDAYSQKYSAEPVIKLWWNYLIEPCL